jgi:putative ABC transport system permease protein
VLLALSVVVSLFGIVNTLVLTIYERDAELGMLRAVGETRWQVRWMVSLESVVTALIAPWIGIALGIVLSSCESCGSTSSCSRGPNASLTIFALVAVVGRP